jgi:hypothetical protein
MRHLSPLVLLLAAGSLAAEEIKFAASPSAERDGKTVRLSFALSQSADVEVAVLDSKDRVVRHLAAGVLGAKNAPPAPLAAGLKQKLTWDGKDDDGNDAKGGPFRFRVRAGTRVSFGRLLGHDPTTGSVTSMPYRAPVNGLVCDDKGNLVVKIMSSIGSHGNSGLWPWHLRQFDAEGKYVKTLLPHAPSTPADRATGFELLKTPDKRLTPANQTSLYPVFFSLGNEIVPRLHDNSVVFVHSEKRRLNFFALDGSNKVKSVVAWPAKSKLKCPIWLDIQVALSPDGKYAYYANVAGTAYDGKHPKDIDSNWPQGRVYRQDLSRENSEPETFFDLTQPDFDKQKYWMPSAWDKKTAAAALDVDAKGNVLVCDLVNGQVVEVSPAGKQLSATKVEWPDRVLVSRKTGDLYVVSRKVSRGYLPPATLYKITGRGDKARVVAQVKLDGTVGGAFTIDESGKSPVLWLAGHRDQQAQDSTRLLRVEDRGEKLVVTGDKFLNSALNAISFVSYLAIDREAELVYVTRGGEKVWRYDGETGKGGLLSIKAVDLAVGRDGTVYTWGTSGSYSGPLARYTRDLKPAPLASTKQHTYGYVYGRAGRGSSVCGMDVGRDGKVYATFGTNECHVRVYDADGELVAYPRKAPAGEGKKGEVPAVITGATGYGGSVRVDGQGNVYLLQAGVPKDHRAPKGFEKDEAYRQAMGTIYKFSPKGGEIEEKNGIVKKVNGAVTSYPGCGPVSRWNAVGACACTKPRFDVDPYGRLYVPDAITFSVSVRDNANNEILRFGGYGNLDCQGPKSKESAPEIPLGWPVAVVAGQKHLYVGDCLNHRVVRVDRSYAAEATAEVPR